jgi:hypothetical protein
VSGDAQEARNLARQAHTVHRVSGLGSWRAALRWISGGTLDPTRCSGRLWLMGHGLRGAARLARERAAHLDNQLMFAVDYQPCRRCGLAWVEQPYTDPRYLRRVPPRRHTLPNRGARYFPWPRVRLGPITPLWIRIRSRRLRSSRSRGQRRQAHTWSAHLGTHSESLIRQRNSHIA